MFNLFELRGVRDYWVLDPAAWSVWVCKLAAPGRFDKGELRDRLGDVSPIQSEVLKGFVVDPIAHFANLDYREIGSFRGSHDDHPDYGPSLFHVAADPVFPPRWNALRSVPPIEFRIDISYIHY
jgi:hypothetical protein